MNPDDQRVSPARRPLLLNFVRRQPAGDIHYCYDAALRLNVTARDGIPVVATACGRAALKTQAVQAED
jgi:hypothetical protein